MSDVPSLILVFPNWSARAEAIMEVVQEPIKCEYEACHWMLIVVPLARTLVGDALETGPQGYADTLLADN